MQTETELFFAAIVREDRSVLDFLDADFTFVNERLARHYGIAGVKGDEFRRVTLDGEQRGGVLTQASVLTVTSNPTRTSPVKRGKWVLENLLGTPPPPPPPDVPQLDRRGRGRRSTGSLRQRMEQHRAKADCAVCHNRMDPLGFGLENFDAIGAWRTKDGKFEIDPSGDAARRPVVRRPRELKAILKARQDDFVRCLAEKMLTYALGRGVEYSDKCTVDDIAKAMRAKRLQVLELDPGDRPQRPLSEAPRHREQAMSEAWRISRRTVLRGLGTAVALPLLDAMAPALALAADDARSRADADGVRLRAQRHAHARLDARGRRATISSCPTFSSRWPPSRTSCWCSAAWRRTTAAPHGDGAGDHARALASFLTGSRPARRTAPISGSASRSTRSPPARSASRPGSPRSSWAASAGPRPATATRAIAARTRRTSPGAPTPRRWPRKSIPSWSSSGCFPIGGAAEQRSKREKFNKSVLDFVLEDARDLQAKLGVKDQRKLDEYLSSVRELEQRIAAAGRNPDEPLPDYPAARRHSRRTTPSTSA